PCPPTCPAAAAPACSGPSRSCSSRWPRALTSSSRLCVPTRATLLPHRRLRPLGLRHECGWSTEGDMPEYLSPGVYVEEVSYRAKAIEGVSTVFLGVVPRSASVIAGAK